MGISKIEFGNRTLIDLTGDSIAPETLLFGVTAHDAKGDSIVGTYEESGSDLPSVITAGDTPVMMNDTRVSKQSTSYIDLGVSLNIPISGTYRFKISRVRGSAASGTYGTALYRNGTLISGTDNTTWTTGYTTQNIYHDVQCQAGDVISVYGRSSSSTTYITIFGLTACINWDNGF